MDSPLPAFRDSVALVHHKSILSYFDQFGIPVVPPERVKFVYGGCLRLLVLAIVCAYTVVVVDEYVSTPLIRVVRKAPSDYVDSNIVVGVSGTGACANTSSTYQRPKVPTLCTLSRESTGNPVLCPAASALALKDIAFQTYLCDFPVYSAIMSAGPSAAFACNSEEELSQSSIEVSTFAMMVV